MSVAGGTQLARQVEEVMSDIQHRGWDVMTADDFNPVTLALELLDGTSHSRDLPTFDTLRGRLEHAMDFIVGDNYQAFNNSIESFGSVVEHISKSQAQVRGLKGDLTRCKELLRCRRSDLQEHWYKNMLYKEMLRLLDGIEQLKSVPKQVDKLVQGKFYLTAVRSLLAAIKTANGGDYEEVGALADLRATLQSMRDTLHETILEDLHRHLYMKSAFCDESLFGQILMPTAEDTLHFQNASWFGAHAGTHTTTLQRTESTLSSAGGAATTAAGKKHRRFRSDVVAALTQKARADAKLDEPISPAGTDVGQLAEDVDRVPEEDPLKHVEIMVHALELLHHLDTAVDVMKQRLPLELFKLVEKVIAEVQERWAGVMLSSPAERDTNNRSLQLLPHGNDPVAAYILEDLLLTLYKKLHWISNMHRFTIQTMLRVAQKSANNTSGGNVPAGNQPLPATRARPISKYTMNDLWNGMQAEIKSMLSEILKEAVRSLPPMAFHLESSSRERLNNAPLFRFSDSSAAGSDSYSALPGSSTSLSKSKSTKNASVHFLESGIVDMLESAHETSGHKSIVQSSIYNLPFVLGPTLTVVKKLENDFFGKADRVSDVNSYLNDMLMKTFLPQLEDIVAQKFRACVNGPDSFRVETVEQAERPVFKSAISVLELIRDFAASVYRIPVHQENLVKIIETILQKYYEKCNARYRAAIVKEGAEKDTPAIVTSSIWAQKEEIVTILRQNTFLYDREYDNGLNDALSKKELTAISKLKSDRKFHVSELILDVKRLELLANIRYTLLWFSGQVDKLRRRHHLKQIQIDVLPPSEVEILPSTVYNDTSRIASGHGKEEYSEAYIHQAICIRLNEDVFQRWNTLLAEYQNLSEQCLFLLHMEMRCHCLYYLDRTLLEGNYAMEDMAMEPDAHVLSLNSDLIACDSALRRSLPTNENSFVFDGLAVVITHILIHGARHLKALTKPGVTKMLKNVLAMQQNLSNLSLSYETRLDRARKFYNLFHRSVDEMLKEVEEQEGSGYSMEEYKVVLDLFYRRYFDLPEHPQMKIYKDAIARLQKVCGVSS